MSVLDLIVNEVEYRRTLDEEGAAVPGDFEVWLYGVFLGWIWKHRGSWFCTAGNASRSCRTKTEVTLLVLDLRRVLRQS